LDREFDWDSIMMYFSWVGAKDFKSPTIVKKVDGSTFEDPKGPSLGGGKSILLLSCLHSANIGQ
jgi:hypothetical protein